MQTEKNYRYELPDMQDEQAAKAYENFIATHKNGCFMQSLSWARVKTGWRARIVTVKNTQEQICGAMLVLIKTLPLVHISFLYAPRGPVCDLKNYDVLDCLFAGARDLAGIYNACAFRIDPFVLQTDTAFLYFIQTRGFHFVPNAEDNGTAQTRCNYLLPIGGKSPAEIFASFKAKLRYNIRLAQKKGVTCTVCGQEALDDFMTLMRQTGKRDGFAIRSRSYFAQMLRAFPDNCRLYMCYKENTPLSGAVCMRFGRRTCYVYGASSNENRNLMPNYLMQWNMILWAQEGGCELYDFMGVPHYDDPMHRNYGVYRFKQCFNGKVAVYAGEFTYVYKTGKKHIWDFCFFLYRLALRLAYRLEQLTAGRCNGFYPPLQKKHAAGFSFFKRHRHRQNPTAL